VLILEFSLRYATSFFGNIESKFNPCSANCSFSISPNSIFFSGVFFASPLSGLEFFISTNSLIVCFPSPTTLAGTLNNTASVFPSITKNLYSVPSINSSINISLSSFNANSTAFE
jgi:hypothetical protein